MGLTVAPHAYAQDNPGAGAKPGQEYSQLPDEYLDETEDFYKHCSTTSEMKNYYNCECLAVKFLDQRVARGPNPSRESITLSIQRECADASQAAGYYYQNCMNQSVLMPPEIPAEEYCTCFANTYAKLYERYSPGPSSKAFVQLQTQAYVTCRDPELAKRLYPYVPPAASPAR